MRRVINFLAVLALLSGCTKAPQRTSQVQLMEIEADTLNIADMPTRDIKEPKLFFPIENLDYSILKIDSTDQLQDMKDSLSDNDWNIIAALNRKDINRIRVGDSLIYPDTFASDILFYSPFPRYIPGLDSISQCIFVSLEIQAYAAYENGELVRWAPVSTGKGSTTTPDGLFFTNFHHKRKISTVNSSWIMPWYFNIDIVDGIGLHEYDLPGYPASHGCIRMREADARWNYNWGEQWRVSSDGYNILKYGTPVFVYGEYDHTQPAPWYRLAENSEVMRQLPDDLQTMVFNHREVLVTRNKWMLEIPSDSINLANN